MTAKQHKLYHIKTIIIKSLMEKLQIIAYREIIK